MLLACSVDLCRPSVKAIFIKSFGETIKGWARYLRQYGLDFLWILRLLSLFSPKSCAAKSANRTGVLYIHRGTFKGHTFETDLEKKPNNWWDLNRRPHENFAPPLRGSALEYRYPWASFFFPNFVHSSRGFFIIRMGWSIIGLSSTNKKLHSRLFFVMSCVALCTLHLLCIRSMLKLLKGPGTDIINFL